MAHARIEAGICGFVTDVRATSDDRRHVTLAVTSTCPDVKRIAKQINDRTWDAFAEIGPCAQPGSMYDTEMMKVCGRLPHVACPVPPGICKAMEVAAGLAIAQDAHITVEAETEEEAEAGAEGDEEEGA
jgi:hypothetical protein